MNVYIADALQTIRPGVRELECRERLRWWAMVSMIRRHWHWLTSALPWEKELILLWTLAVVTLMTSDLLLLPKAFGLSKQTVKLIHQNLF